MCSKQAATWDLTNFAAFWSLIEYDTAMQWKRQLYYDYSDFMEDEDPEDLDDYDDETYDEWPYEVE